MHYILKGRLLLGPQMLQRIEKRREICVVKRFTPAPWKPALLLEALENNLLSKRIPKSDWNSSCAGRCNINRAMYMYSRPSSLQERRVLTLAMALHVPPLTHAPSSKTQNLLFLRCLIGGCRAGSLPRNLADIFCCGPLRRAVRWIFVPWIITDLWRLLDCVAVRTGPWHPNEWRSRKKCTEGLTGRELCWLQTFACKKRKTKTHDKVKCN